MPIRRICNATAMSFQEVDEVLSSRLRAALVVVIADACHTGRLGWSSYSATAPSRAAEPLARIGQGDRSFLKLLAARPSERSYEDEKWNGGHGAFTHVLLEGLSGQADSDGDRVIRASEAIEYVSRRVPELTDSQQHPRVAVPRVFTVEIRREDLVVRGEADLAGETLFTHPEV